MWAVYYFIHSQFWFQNLNHFLFRIFLTLLLKCLIMVMSSASWHLACSTPCGSYFGWVNPKFLFDGWLCFYSWFYWCYNFKFHFLHLICVSFEAWSIRPILTSNLKLVNSVRLAFFELWWFSFCCKSGFCAVLFIFFDIAVKFEASLYLSCRVVSHVLPLK